MPYIAPRSVLSPKGRVKDIDVVYDRGPEEFSWSIATLKWDGKDAVGIRWNGDAGDSNLGSPQSRGIATWFIVPQEIAGAVLSAAKDLETVRFGDLQEGYRAMAADRERESEAEAWSEALIGDGFETR